jgi:cytoskeletal protein CcmA (bactofilin family)
MLGRHKKHRIGKIDTLVGQNSSISGDVTFEGGLHIDGQVIGNVFADAESSATLTLSDHGRVEGEVRVPNIILNGTVNGDVYASGKIELAPNARINGNVYYNLLEMAMGAEVNGSLVHQAEKQALTDKPVEKSEVRVELRAADNT